MEHLQITKTRKKHSNQKNVLNQIDTKILSMNQVPYLLYRTFFQQEHQQFGDVHGKKLSSIPDCLFLLFDWAFAPPEGVNPVLPICIGRGTLFGLLLEMAASA